MTYKQMCVVICMLTLFTWKSKQVAHLPQEIVFNRNLHMEHKLLGYEHVLGHFQANVTS